MKAQGKVKGILIEGDDGQEYLLGFGPTERTGPPTLSRPFRGSPSVEPKRNWPSDAMEERR